MVAPEWLVWRPRHRVRGGGGPGGCGSSPGPGPGPLARDPAARPSRGTRARHGSGPCGLPGASALVVAGPRGLGAGWVVGAAPWCQAVVRAARVAARCAGCIPPGADLARAARSQGPGAEFALVDVLPGL